MSAITTIESCDSTNKYLHARLAAEPMLPSGTTVRAVTQTAGRGQRGNSWEAEPGKNLTFSMVLRPGPLGPARHFLLSEAVAIAVARFLQSLPEMCAGHDVRIKWPNDILVDGKKIAGILIENALGPKGELIYSIVGIGLNVNQKAFSDAAPMATSIARLTGREYDLYLMMESLADMINGNVERLSKALSAADEMKGFEEIQEEYYRLLWRERFACHKWLDARTDEIFAARLAGVLPSGHLCLQLPEGGERRYLFKEVFPV